VVLFLELGPKNTSLRAYFPPLPLLSSSCAFEYPNKSKPTKPNNKAVYLAENNLHWQRLLRRITELDYLEKEQRESDLLFYDATERYLNFKKDHPDWDAKLQLRHVASYLGMSPETLSRIRKNLIPEVN